LGGMADAGSFKKHPKNLQRGNQTTSNLQNTFFWGGGLLLLDLVDRLLIK
jgi:hypothetical protein